MNVINNIYKYVNMYELPTVYANDFTQSVVLPTNMYEMPKIYDTTLIATESNAINGQISPVLVDPNLFKEVDKHLALNPLKDLLSRQQLLLKRLEVLENGMDSLEKPVKTDLKKSTDSHSICPNKTPKTGISSTIGCTDEVLNSIKDVVIVSDGKQIPLSVLALIKLMKNLGLKILVKQHIHSSLCLKNESPLDQLNKCLSLVGLNQESVERRLNNDLILTFIFKNVSGIKMILCPNDLMAIESEANILRFMARFAAKVRPELSYLYEGIEDISRLTAVDNFVDKINAKIFTNFEEKFVSKLDLHLSSNSYLCPNSPTIADLLLWSGLSQRISTKLSPNLNKWLDSMKQMILNENKTF